MAGWFAGSLDNSGERIGVALTLPGASLLRSIIAPSLWPADAVGAGASIEVVEQQREPMIRPTGKPASWRFARRSNGSPERPLIRINERNRARIATGSNSRNAAQRRPTGRLVDHR